jgi:hypothetical protein
MWAFLNQLPPVLAYTLIVLLLVTVVIIALYGRFKAKVGDKEIDIGEGGKASRGNSNQLSPTNQTNQIPPPPATSIFYHQKRSCGDCVLILLAEREKYEFTIHQETDRILRSQMNFAEQKLIEIQTLLINSYSDELYKRKTDGKVNDDDESVQLKLFYGLIKDGLYSIKDEIRKALKHNGFSLLVGADFNYYVEDKMKTFISNLGQYIRNIYPSRGMTISVFEMLKLLEQKSPVLESAFNEMFITAKDIKLEAEEKTNQLKRAFGAWIDSFIK